MIKTLLNPNHVLSDCDNLQDIDAQRMAAVLGKHLYGFKKGEEKPIVKVLGLDANDDVRWSASSVPGGGLPPSTPEDEGKVLVVGDDGQPEWADIPSGHGETLYSIDSASQGNWDIDSTYATAQFYLDNDGDNQGVDYQLDASDRKAGYKLEVDHVYQVNYNCEVVSSNQVGKVWEGSIYITGAQDQNWYFQLDGSQNLGLSLTGSTIVHCISSSNDALYFNARLNGSYLGSLPTMSLAKVSIVDLTSIGGGGSVPGPQYRPGPGIEIEDDVISIDPTEAQEKLTAGPNITIANNIISTDKTVVAAGNNVSVTSSYEPSTRTVTYTVHSAGGSGTSVQSNWAEQDPLEPSYIQNKPQNLVQDASYVHTDNNFTTTEKLKLDGIESGAEANVQANWNETNVDSDAYIQNKPQNLVQDASYVHTDNNFTTTEKLKLDGIQSGAEANVQSNWNETDTGSDAYIQNKPQNLVQDASYVHTDNNFTTTLKDKLDGIQSGAEANVQADWNESDSSSDAYIRNKPNIPAGVVVDQVYDSTSTDAQSGVAVAQAVAGVNAVPSSTSADENKVLTVDSSGDPVWATAATPTQVQSNWTESNSSAVSYIQNKPQNLVQDASYVHTDNNFTTTLKDKLDGIQSGAEANVQADWNESDSTSDAYILNKPTIPVIPAFKELVAGSGITITEGTDTVTIASNGGSGGSSGMMAIWSGNNPSNGVAVSTSTTLSSVVNTLTNMQDIYNSPFTSGEMLSVLKGISAFREGYLYRIMMTSGALVQGNSGNGYVVLEVKNGSTTIGSSSCTVSRSVGSNVTIVLDVYIPTGVSNATLFMTFNNILSGTWWPTFSITAM